MQNNNICNCTPQNPKIVDKTLANMPSADDFGKVSAFFKVMGDSTRLQILTALIHNELCVSDIACVLNMSQSAISHQLKVLRQSKLVKTRQDGRSVYYSLDDEHVTDIVAEAMEHVLDC